MGVVIYNGTPVQCCNWCTTMQRGEHKAGGQEKLRVVKWPAMGVGCIMRRFPRVNGNYATRANNRPHRHFTLSREMFLLKFYGHP